MRPRPAHSTTSFKLCDRPMSRTSRKPASARSRSKSYPGRSGSLLLRYQVLIGRCLKVHVTAEGHRIPEGQNLCRPKAANPVLPVDPIEQVGQSCPAERSCWTTCRRLDVV